MLCSTLPCRPVAASAKAVSIVRPQSSKPNWPLWIRPRVTCEASQSPARWPGDFAGAAARAGPPSATPAPDTRRIETAAAAARREKREDMNCAFHERSQEAERVTDGTAVMWGPDSDPVDLDR